MSGVHVMLAEHIDSTLRLHSETMPNHNCLFLPQAWSRLTIFNMGWPLVQLIHPGTQQAAARRLFYRVWHKDFNHVRVPKWYPFSRCSVCSSLKEMKTKAARDKEIKAKCDSVLSAHNAINALHKFKYQKHIRKAVLHPRKYLSIIFDGMDQNKVCFPYSWSMSKTVDAKYQCKCQLEGFITHGVDARAYLQPGVFKHDSNMSIHLLMTTLLALPAPLPDVLYLQLDNCWRENKNQIVFSFLALLVQLNVFRKIKVSFHLVGEFHIRHPSICIIEVRTSVIHLSMYVLR